VNFTDPEGLNPAIGILGGPVGIGIVGATACFMSSGCRDVVSKVASGIADAVKNSINGNGEPLPAPDPMEMAKGGKQNIENEWSREARQHPNPCDWLEQEYNRESDSEIRKKIKKAQKAVGCRQNSTTNEKCK
jgi:hypothetical protein